MVATSIFLTLSGGTVIGQIVFTPTAKNRATPEEFTILPWGISSATPEALKDIYECGFNLAGFTDAESLDRVAAAGLKTIVIDNSIHANDSTASMSDDEITSRVNAVASRQPLTRHCTATTCATNRVSGCSRVFHAGPEAVRKAAPRALPYINLFPNYVGADALANGTYDNYLDVFARDVKTGYLSYDHYALMDDGSLRGGYYANLDSARRMSLKHGIPFWNIVLSKPTSLTPNRRPPACASRPTPRWPTARAASATSPTSARPSAITVSHPSTSSATRRRRGTCCATSTCRSTRWRRSTRSS